MKVLILSILTSLLLIYCTQKAPKEEVAETSTTDSIATIEEKETNFEPFKVPYPTPPKNLIDYEISNCDWKELDSGKVYKATLSNDTLDISFSFMDNCILQTERPEVIRSTGNVLEIKTRGELYGELDENGDTVYAEEANGCVCFFKANYKISGVKQIPTVVLYNGPLFKKRIYRELYEILYNYEEEESEADELRTFD